MYEALVPEDEIEIKNMNNNNINTDDAILRIFNKR